MASPAAGSFHLHFDKDVSTYYCADGFLEVHHAVGFVCVLPLNR